MGEIKRAVFGNWWIDREYDWTSGDLAVAGLLTLQRQSTAGAVPSHCTNWN
jgi:hypothetical protein